MELYDSILELQATRQRAALVTVIETRGSTPRKPGAKMLVFSDGRTKGSIGGGRVEYKVIKAAQKVLKTEHTQIIEYHLTSELAMCCGGKMTFFVESLVPHPPLMIFGCGHVGSAIIHAASPLQFELIAIDDHEQNLAPEKLPQAEQRLASYEPEDLKTLPFGPQAFIVIATRDHSLDQKLLEFCSKQQFQYLGIIGSQRKATMQIERLRAKNFSDDVIDRIRCPIGLSIGAVTPSEIAISVCAELIAERRSNADD